MTAQVRDAAYAAATAAGARSIDARPRASRLILEANATFAVAWREVLRAIKSRQMIAINIIFPVLFMGLMGGMIQQNLGNALPFAYLPFMLVGMVAQTMYQGGMMGVTTLIEERENGFTAELFVAPVTRYAVLLGRIVGSSIASMVSLVGVLAMIVVMQIPVDAVDVLRVVALAPILAFAGGALGVLFIGFVQDPKTADVGSMLLVMPQMFLAGSIIPNAASSGILGVLAKLMPMTYVIDLARNVFYAGKPEYAAVVQYPFALDLVVSAGIFVAFLVIGTVMFVRNDRNR
jgi:ABC-2 type transport system permease protein